MHGMIAAHRYRKEPRAEPSRIARRRLMIAAGVGLAAAIAAAHLMLGTVSLSRAQVMNVLIGQPESIVHHHIVWNLRLPRVLVALAAGAMLGLAGAILQSLTRNPLAEPGLMGVTGGAVLAIVAAIALASRVEGLGMVRETIAWLGLVGVVGGLAAGTLTFALAWRGTSDPALLVLIGVLVAATLGALSTLVLLTAEEDKTRLVLHWTIGSTNGRVWVHWYMIWPFALSGLVGGFLAAGVANALQLGDATATGLGVPVERARLLLLFIAAWLTAGAVSVVGGIGFIGLIGPHLARGLVGADARKLFPAAALLSALLLIAADLAARIVPLGWLGEISGLPISGQAGLPVGAITPLLGVPFLLYLLLRRQGSAP